MTALRAAMPLAEAADAFLDHLGGERHLAANTVAAYRQDLTQFLRYLGPRVLEPRVPLTAVRPEALAGYVQALESRGMAAASIARKLAAIRSLFTFLARRGVTGANPARAVRKTVPRRQTPPVLRLERIDAALDAAADGGFRGARDRALIAILYGGGIELGELCGLNLSALALDQGTVRVLGRGRRERVVPIGRAAVALLRVYLQQRAELLVGLDLRHVQAGALFVNCRGGRLARRSVERIVGRCLRAAGPPATGAVAPGPRLLRHAYAAHLLSAGADPGAVRQLLGHVVALVPATSSAPAVEELVAVYRRTHPHSGWGDEPLPAGSDGGPPPDQAG